MAPVISVTGFKKVTMQTKSKREEFLEQPIESNIEFCTSQILLGLSEKQIVELHKAINDLDVLLYKSWAKDMPFRDIRVALKDAFLLINN